MSTEYVTVAVEFCIVCFVFLLLLSAMFVILSLLVFTFMVCDHNYCHSNYDFVFFFCWYYYHHHTLLTIDPST